MAICLFFQFWLSFFFDVNDVLYDDFLDLFALLDLPSFSFEWRRIVLHMVFVINQNAVSFQKWTNRISALYNLYNTAYNIHIITSNLGIVCYMYIYTIEYSYQLMWMCVRHMLFIKQFISAKKKFMVGR